ncbi:hypothetical protein ASB65_26240 [Agrobacterium tumefaciens str. B6]|nr:hypothetical protein ASB65_26240 [Agrobacterium tumefaciens str. B6]OCJ34056.1 hypothetical protein A6U90_26055 [Agrobacterium tumefaciens]
MACLLWGCIAINMVGMSRTVFCLDVIAGPGTLRGKQHMLPISPFQALGSGVRGSSDNRAGG